MRLVTKIPSIDSCSQSYIHTLLNYMLLGAGFTPVVAAVGFLITGACYAAVTERMLARFGDVDSSYYGMSISVVMYVTWYIYC